MIFFLLLLLYFLNFVPLRSMDNSSNKNSLVAELRINHLKKLPTFFCQQEPACIYLNGEKSKHVLGWDINHGSFVVEDGEKIVAFAHVFFSDQKAFLGYLNRGRVGVIETFKSECQFKNQDATQKLFVRVITFFKENDVEKIKFYLKPKKYQTHYLNAEGFTMVSDKYFEKNNLR